MSNVFDPYTFDYKTYVKSAYDLDESPSRYRDLDIEEDDAILNSKSAVEVEKKDKFIENYKWESFTFRLFKIKQDDITFINLLDMKFPFIYMRHSFREIKINKLNGIENSNIWSWRTMRGLARHWIFDKILKDYDFVLSDKVHTPKGEIFWKKLIGNAIDKRLKCNVFNPQTNKVEFDVNSEKELEKYYGVDKAGYRFIIFK